MSLLPCSLLSSTFHRRQESIHIETFLTTFFILFLSGAFSLLGNIFLEGITPDQVFWVGATSLTVGDHAHFAGVALTCTFNYFVIFSSSFTNMFLFSLLDTNIVIADFAQVYGRLWTQTEVSTYLSLTLYS